METEDEFMRKMLPKALDRILNVKNIDGQLLTIDDSVSLAKDIISLAYEDKMTNKSNVK